jgi:hypothetical protein
MTPAQKLLFLNTSRQVMSPSPEHQGPILEAADPGGD